MAASSLKIDCPHCSTRGSGFEINYRRSSRSIKYHHFSMATCGICDFPIVFRYKDHWEGQKYTETVNIVAHNHAFPGQNFEITNVWPSSGDDIPERLPDNIESFFVQAINNERAEQWDAAGAMFRKTLDTATKIIDPSLSSQNLFNRINSLCKAGRLTADLGAWAHEVRIDGNSSVHDETPETADDVAALHEFSRAILLYTFTIPALVASRSSSDDKAGDSGA